MKKIISRPTIKKFRKDRRFKFIQNIHQKGVVQNFEYAVKLALKNKAKAIAFCDQDDVWMNDKLEVLLRELGKCPPGSVVHSDSLVFEGRRIYKWTNWDDFNPAPRLSKFRHILLHNTVTGHSMLFDHSLARSMKRAPGFRSVYHDRWFAMAATLKGGVWPVDSTLVKYRQHRSNELGAVRLRRRIKRKKIMLHRVKKYFKKDHWRHGLMMLTDRLLISRSAQVSFNLPQRYRSRAFVSCILILAGLEYGFQLDYTRFHNGLFYGVCGLLAIVRDWFRRRFTRRRSAPRRQS